MSIDREDISIEEKIDKAIRATSKVNLHVRTDPNGNIDVLKLTR